MTFLECVLVGGEYDQRIPVANAAGILQQGVDIAGLAPITLQCIVQRMLELRESAIKRHASDRPASPNTMDTSSPRRRLSAANMHKALAATWCACSPETQVPVISCPTSSRSQAREVHGRSRCTTIGRPARALVFQSIRFASSPGS